MTARPSLLSQLKVALIPTPLRGQLARAKRAYLGLRALGCAPWRPLIIFDVGANNGSSFSHMLRWVPWVHFYAFEPTPEMLAVLRQLEAGFRNYHVVPKAVGETPGVMQFNVAAQGDWGCSSLSEFSDGLDRTWPGRSDLKFTQQIDVEVIRLDEFVRQHRIPRIDFLHIDTQGTDLNVLRSLGEEIGRVRAGVIEVPQNRSVMLYRNQHTREEAEEFLARNHFKVWKVVSQQNEDNLYFRRDS